MFKNRKQIGSAALTMVMIVSALLIIGGVTVMQSNIDIVYATRSYSVRTNLEIQTQSCFEESMRKLVIDKDFVGSVENTNGEFYCTADISLNSTDSDLKDIVITATYRNHSIQVFRQADISVPPFY
jgi:hypothetical protein